MIFLSGHSLSAQQSSETLIRQAYERAWKHDYDGAVRLFDSLLAVAPDNLDAQRGRGYTLAWQGNYGSATRQFDQLLAGDPSDWEARKGLAYVALWSRHYELAAQRLEALLPDAVESDEIHHSLGTAYLGAGRHKDARAQVALIGDEERANQLAAAIQADRAEVELIAWGGWTNVGSSNNGGLRAAQLIWTPKPRSSIWVRFDNTLGIDNAAVFLRDSSAMALLAGGSWQPRPNWTLQGEAGQRWLPGQSRQQLLLLEQTWFMVPRLGWKTGAFAALGGPQNRNLLLHTGLIWQAGSRFWLEPTAYATWFSPGQFDQMRLSLSGKYHHPRGYELNLGVLGGTQYLMGESNRAPVAGLWLQYQHPLPDWHWLYLAARYEKTADAPFINVSLGLRLRIEE